MRTDQRWARVASLLVLDALVINLGVALAYVLRSFTTAAFAFAAGARTILPVSAIADAQALRARFPGALAMGALGGGWPIPSFDLSNSPAALVGRDLGGRRIIHCTAAGVRGLVRSRRADRLLASSMVCAGATARYLRRLAPPAISGRQAASVTTAGVPQAIASTSGRPKPS